MATSVRTRTCSIGTTDRSGTPTAFHSVFRGSLLELPKMRFHDLRHGFASLAFAAGVSLKVVSESLGHSGIAITSSTYIHLHEHQKREKSERLDAYLGAVIDNSADRNRVG